MRQIQTRRSGFSLVELMVAVALGLMVLAGLVTLFASNSSIRNEIERAQQQLGSGNYAMDLLAEDLRMAGYFGDYEPTATPTSITGATLCVHTPTNLPKTLLFPVMGLAVGGTDGTLCGISGITTKANTSLLTIRRTSTCTSADTGCVDTATDPLFQVSLCSTESSTTPYKLSFVLSEMTLRKKNCGTGTADRADIRKYIVRIYYVSPNHIAANGNTILNNSGASIPTLNRLELVNSEWTSVPLVEGVERMVLEYGIDTTPKDGSPDQYLTDPGALCAGDAACIAQNWSSVVSIRVNLLVRARDITPGYADQRSYVVAGSTLGPFSDGYKRRVYSSVVRLNNIADRRLP